MGKKPEGVGPLFEALFKEFFFIFELWSTDEKVKFSKSFTWNYLKIPNFIGMG